MSAISPSSPDPRALVLKKRALTELSKAFEEARGALPCDWVWRGDPDLASLRDDADLELVTQRYCSGTKPEQRPDDADWQGVMRDYQLREEKNELRGYPDRPWGDPERRATSWAMFALACLEGALLYAVLSGPSKWVVGLGLVALALFAAARSAFAWHEAGRSDTEVQARRLAAPTPRE